MPDRALQGQKRIAMIRDQLRAFRGARFRSCCCNWTNWPGRLPSLHHPGYAYRRYNVG